jgi:ubiquinone/menaquinone biosynthesis C-methylase UbiE
MSIENPTRAAGPYVLGHSDEELERLGRQARLVDPMTRRFFQCAGIGPGMRVLDVGSGAGHVSMIVADLVGTTGQVVGVDRSPVALQAAEARIGASNIRHVTFLEGDPAGMDFEGAFDAVVGRYVLMFQPDPVAMLRGVAKHVRPGGVVVFHEPDWSGVRTLPRVPLYEDACRWIVEAIEKNATESRMGMKLHPTFLAAGLPAPEMGLDAVVGGGEDMERIRFITEIVGTLQESIVRAGVASASEIGLMTLADRIAADAIAKGAVLASRSEIGAWCRAPK